MVTSILPLISAVFILTLGIIVFLKNRKLKVNIIFFWLSIMITAWLFSTFMLFVSETDDKALFWDRNVYAAVVFIPTLMYHFSLVFSKNKEKKNVLYLGYFLSVVFLIVSRTDYFVADLFKYQWGVHAKAKFLHHIFLVYFSVYLFYFYYNIYHHYRRTKIGIERNQAKYIFVSFLMLLIGALGYLPAYGISIYPFAYLSGVLFAVILAYAIVRYRLMDIRMVVKRSSIFSLIVIAITAVYAMSAYLVSWVIFGSGGSYTFRTQIVTGLIVALLVSIAFRPLYEWLKKITDSFLFTGEYKPQELMADISDVVSRTLDLNVVIDTLKDEISKALRIKKMEIIILEEKMGASVTKGDFLMTSKKRKALKKIINYFGKSREVLVLEEIKRKYAENIGSDEDLFLIDDIEKFRVALIVPLLVKRKLVGLFLLREKRSGDMFTNEDIKTLETIAAQAGIAIENARLYEEMRDFSKTLQKEVDSQTKELRDANVRLQQLDKAKSEFISLASHQLRTPLTIIKGYISMILEGTWGEVVSKQREQLDKVYSSNERLIKLVEDLLTVSRIESGRLDFDWELVPLEEMIESIVKEFGQIANKKKLYLKLIKPKKVLPKIKIDSLKIRQVVQNLIDNALHYTKVGGAVIRLEQKQNRMIFSIKDTGIGITPKEQVVLFEKFSRGRDVGKMHTEGVGLGLYLGAKMIEAHQGKIWAESEGKDKGSTFFFSLPIKKKKK